MKSREAILCKSKVARGRMITFNLTSSFLCVFFFFLQFLDRTCWEMGGGGFLNRQGSRGRVSPWLGVGQCPCWGGRGRKPPKTLQNSSICNINLWPVLACYQFCNLAFCLRFRCQCAREKEKKIPLLNSGKLNLQLYNSTLPQ